MADSANTTIWTGLWGRVGGRKLESGRRSNEAATLLAAATEGLRGDEVVLDVGCGPGLVALALAERLPEGEVIALDLSAEMLARLRVKAVERGLSGRVRTVAADVAQTELRDGSVDLITSNVLLHEVRALDPVLAELRRVLRPGGRLVLRDFRRTIVSRAMVRVFHGTGVIGPQTEADFRAALERVGFGDVEVRRDGWAQIGIGVGPRSV